MRSTHSQTAQGKTIHVHITLKENNKANRAKYRLVNLVKRRMEAPGTILPIVL